MILLEVRIALLPFHSLFFLSVRPGPLISPRLRASEPAGAAWRIVRRNFASAKARADHRCASSPPTAHPHPVVHTVRVSRCRSLSALKDFLTLLTTPPATFTLRCRYSEKKFTALIEILHLFISAHMHQQHTRVHDTVLHHGITLLRFLCTSAPRTHAPVALDHLATTRPNASLFFLHLSGVTRRSQPKRRASVVHELLQRRCVREGQHQGRLPQVDAAQVRIFLARHARTPHTHARTK